MNLALNNLQKLICHKTQTTNQKQKHIMIKQFYFKQFSLPYMHSFLLNDQTNLFQAIQFNMTIHFKCQTVVFLNYPEFVTHVKNEARAALNFADQDSSKPRIFVG